MRSLSPQQQKVFDCIKDWIDIHEQPPTREEIAVLLDLDTSTVAGHLAKLRNKRRISWKTGKPRTLAILPYPLDNQEAYNSRNA